MKDVFAHFVSEAKKLRSASKVSGDALFLGLDTSTEYWGQKGLRPVLREEANDTRPFVEDDHADLVDEEAVLQALNISDDLTIPELETIRRSFAKYNHPDKHTAAQGLFEQRMKIANMIIDDLIRSKR